MVTSSDVRMQSVPEICALLLKKSLLLLLYLLWLGQIYWGALVQIYCFWLLEGILHVLQNCGSGGLNNYSTVQIFEETFMA